MKYISDYKYNINNNNDIVFLEIPELEIHAINCNLIEINPISLPYIIGWNHNSKEFIISDEKENFYPNLEKLTLIIKDINGNEYITNGLNIIYNFMINIK